MTSEGELPLVILSDETRGDLLRFERPHQVVIASNAAEVPAALGALQSALERGHHLAGWFAYELLDEQSRGDELLLWFGIFDAPARCARGALRARGRAYTGPLCHEWDASRYAAAFARVQEHIQAGDIYQANLSFRSRFAFAGDPLALFLGLYDAAQAPHSAYIDTGTRQILSLSPELFFTISRSGGITVRPMKGTAARGAAGSLDHEARVALAASDKNRAENIMIVDLMRSDLGRIAETGSVRVRELFDVETYPTLHTMVSTVTAQLRPNRQIGAILDALFPPGSVTGAPKIQAMQVIRELEPSARGAYCGAIGCFAPDGQAAFNVAIRTLQIEGAAGQLGVGGAVVADSNAASEYAECLLKARYFERVRRPIGLIETLRWSGGFVRLDRHLARMAYSAAVFSLPFDRTAALAALASAVRDVAGEQRIRLMLDEAGRFACTRTTLDDEPERWVFAIAAERVDSRDRLLQHKTTWREYYEHEWSHYRAAAEADEVLFVNERGELTEGSRTNLFLRQGDRVYTPPLSSGLLGGVLRGELLESGRCVERVLTVGDLAQAQGIWLGSSLRGLIPSVPAAGTELGSGY